MLRVLGTIVVAVVASASIARADCDPKFFPYAHVAYTIGGSIAGTNAGFRQGLDLATMPVVLCGWREGGGGGSLTMSTDQAHVLGISGVIGSGRTPNYLAVNYGRGASTLAGAAAEAGLVHRFATDVMAAGNGLDLRANFDLILVQLGLHVMIVGVNGPWETMIAATIGIGRF